MGKIKRRRGGRPRAPVEARRYPGTRKVVEQDVRSVAREQRVRLFNVKADDATRAESGYALGRLWASGELSPNKDQAWVMLKAGEEYERIVRDAEKAVDAKKGRSASDFSGSGGFDGWDYDIDSRENPSDEYQRFEKNCREALRKLDEVKNALAEAAELHLDHNVFYAINAWILDDKPVHGYVPSLRIALMTVARLLKLGDVENKRLTLVSSCGTG